MQKLARRRLLMKICRKQDNIFPKWKTNKISMPWFFFLFLLLNSAMAISEVALVWAIKASNWAKKSISGSDI